MTQQKTLEKIQVKPEINHSEYLQIPNTNFIIAEYEPNWTKNFNYENSHKQVLKQGLQVPTPVLFMPHFVNVINAFHNNSSLYDAQGTQVQGERLENLYKYLTTNYNNGAWSWLNAKFVEGNGFNNMDLETITGLDADGNLVTKREPLEPCLWEDRDRYAELKFNSQGLAVERSKDQNYKQGKNIWFVYPKKDHVARFVASRGRSNLYCDRLPSGSDASLRVFSICETNTHNKI